MDVSIIIINYNTFQLTCNCISSVIEKTTSINYEIILVDNASTECDAEKFKTLFPKIKLVKSETNIGFSKGNNLGIKNAKGDFILLLNSDTKLMENSISISYNELIKQNGAGVITCTLIHPNDLIQHNCQSFPSIIKLVVEKCRLHKFLSKKKQIQFLQGFYWDYSEFGFPDWVWGAFFMFKREIFYLLPQRKLDDSFFMYMEDMQWCWDIRNLGYKIVYTPKTKIIHFSGGSYGNKVDFLKTNFNLFIKRNYSLLSYFLLKK